MVKLNKIYTRTGDKGDTGLSDGSRVAKNSLRVAAYGDVDETGAVIGLVRLYTAQNPEVDAMLARIQQDLFDLGADLSTPGDNADALRIIQSQVIRLEKEIDTLNENLNPLTSFILAGGSKASAHLHHARTVSRRAERSIIAAAAHETINPFAIHYINRLSDHLFVLARALNNNGQDDVLWKPGINR